VKDSKNAIDSKSINITVTASPSPLVASAAANPTSGQAPLAANFTGSATGGTPPYSYSWNFGDGQSSSSQNPSHTYNSAGTYIAILTATDSEGLKDDHSLTITVTTPGTSTYELSISSATGSPAPGQGGTTDPSPGNHAFSAGSSVLVKSILNENYRFSKWLGEVGVSNPFLAQITVLLDKAKYLAAHFCTKCGDVTGDLAISPADAQKTFDIYLKRIPNPTECELENADVNSSGTAAEPKITPADAQAIFNKFLKKGELPGDCSGASRTAAAAFQLQPIPLGQVYLTIDDVTAGPNEDLVVPIIIDSSFDIKAFGFDLVFPSESLAFIGVERTDFSRDFDQIGANETTNGTLRVGGYTTHPVSKASSTVLVTLVFRVIGDTGASSSFSIVNTFDDLRHAQVRNGMIRQNFLEQRQTQRLTKRKAEGKRYEF
jgi:PKD repeat protein